ncbi:MAG: LysR family transcriptional regulator, partial [Betaproteobacteria bacterium]|nr:LysR family transcriptional regulator [Betaproteobacteria bacterium]
AGTVTRVAAANHMQLVLTDRSTLTAGRTFGVLASHTWRLADLGAKHAFLRAGLGWGNMPLPMVEEDLSRGTLVRIELEPYSVTGAWLSMYAIHRKDAPPGPAGRWFIQKLKQGQN